MTRLSVWAISSILILPALAGANDSKPLAAGYPIQISDTAIQGGSLLFFAVDDEAAWVAVLAADDPSGRLSILTRVWWKTTAWGQDVIWPHDFFLSSINAPSPLNDPPTLFDPLANLGRSFNLGASFGPTSASPASHGGTCLSQCTLDLTRSSPGLTSQSDYLYNSDQNNDGLYDPPTGSVVGADLNGDGTPEAVYTAQDGYVHAYSTDNWQPLLGWPYFSGGQDLTPPVVGDANNDGQKEVIFAGRAGVQTQFWGVNPGGQVDYTFLVNDPKRPHVVLCADLNQDGLPDLVSVLGNTIYVHTILGEVLPGWPITVDAESGEIDGLFILDDGYELPNVVAETTFGHLWYYGADGSQRFHWDPEEAYGPNRFAIGEEDSTVPHAGPVAADINGDGEVEILLSYNTEVVVLDQEGRVVTGPGGSDPQRYDTGAALYSSPVVADINNDGFLEIAVAGSHPDGGGWLWAWTTEAPADSPRPWPMERLNPQRNAFMAPNQSSE